MSEISNATSSRARRSPCRGFSQDLRVMKVCDLIKFVLFGDSLKLILSVRCVILAGEDDF
jgi:hypothetical protein